MFCILVETAEVLFMKIFFAPKIWYFLALTLNLRKFWLYISGKNGSVLKPRYDLHRKKSTRIKQQNLYTKPKRKFFFEHPVDASFILDPSVILDESVNLDESVHLYESVLLYNSAHLDASIKWAFKYHISTL